MGSSAPTPPDPFAQEAAQTQANTGAALENQLLSQVNQVDPSGSTLTYNQTGSNTVYVPGEGNVAIPQYTATSALSAPEQQLFNTNLQNEQGVSNLGSGLISSAQSDIANTPDLNKYQTGALTGADQKYNAATYDPNSANQYLNTSFIQPFEQQEGVLQNQQDNTLANQGISTGSAAYNNAQSQFSNNENNAFNSEMGQAQQAAQSEAQNAFGINQSSAEQSANQNNASTLNQYTANQAGALQNANIASQNYELPLNSLSGLLSGSQIGGSGITASSSPQYQSIQTPQVASDNIAGQMQSSYEDQLQASQQSGGLLGGILGGAGSLLKAVLPSDRRLKYDISHVGHTAGGTKVYSYHYKWETRGTALHIGVMADEVPEAAIMTPSGYYFVDYSKIT